MSWEAVRTKTVCFSDKSDISLGGWIVELVLDSQKVPCLLVGIQDTLSQPADKSAAAKGLWITTSYLMVTILDNTFKQPLLGSIFVCQQELMLKSMLIS